mmetsp:Transcript_32874/g.42239  ORF Transcript_32874/g.42239 Transcript_32874/m.42239 type:complete len:124 (+) Transcript_32874:641-1012(+)
MVLDYTCLWWATMFQDRCFNETSAPRKPCRSFCVNVGLTCANDPFDWVNLCHNIECPTKEGKCSRNAENITKQAEGTFADGSQDCWVTKVPSAYSAAFSNRRLNIMLSITTLGMMFISTIVWL